MDIAAKCFAEAMNDPELQSNPFLQALEGRAWLSMEKLDDARVRYEEALRIARAAGDPAVTFRLRRMYADDFFLRNRIQIAYEAAAPTLESEYPIERAWGLSQKAIYYWSQGELETSLEALVELQHLYPTVVPERDLDWQRRRFEDIGETVEMMEGAFEGNPVARVALAVEALDYDQRSGNFLVGFGRIEAIVKEFPIEDYQSWADPKLREWLVWAHYNYYIGLYSLGSGEKARDGLERFILNVSFEEFPARVVEAWLRLGWFREVAGDLEGAIVAYETGFGLDVAGLDREDSDAVFPMDFTQPRVLDAHSIPEQRAQFVASYERLTRRLGIEGEVSQ